MVGVAGVEAYFDEYLHDPNLEGSPLRLSIDLSAQAVMEDVLEDGMIFMNAKGASAVMMDVFSGEILAMSLAGRLIIKAPYRLLVSVTVSYLLKKEGN